MPNGKKGWAKSKAPTLAPAKSDAARAKLGVVNPFSQRWMPTQRATTSLPGPVQKA